MVRKEDEYVVYLKPVRFALDSHERDTCGVPKIRKKDGTVVYMIDFTMPHPETGMRLPEFLRKSRRRAYVDTEECTDANSYTGLFRRQDNLSGELSSPSSFEACVRDHVCKSTWADFASTEPSIKK
jgi:hypothetical protein